MPLRSNKRLSKPCLASRREPPYTLLNSVWLALSLMATSVTAAETALPEYVCHPAQEGKAQELSPETLQKILDTAALPPQQAVETLQALRAGARLSKVSAPTIDYEIAWRLSELGPPQAAREAAMRVLDNVYISGRQVDMSRALIAQTYADEAQWPAVVDTLAPMTAAACRDIPDAWRYLLATAYLKLKQYPDALREIDAAEPGNDAEDLQWLRAALTMDCSLNGGAACTTRVLTYAEDPAPAEVVTALLDAQIAALQADPSLDAASRMRLDAARTQGLLDEHYRVIAKAAPEVLELEPLGETVLPEYPRDALRRTQQGYVVLLITVNPDGTVKHAEVRDSAPAHVFDQSALAAASKNRYRPKQVNGAAVETTGTYRVTYRMADD